MTPTFQTPHITVYTGDVLAVLRDLTDESVDCVVTSPPYWSLRDYGVVGQLGLERTPEEYVAAMVGVFAEVRRVLSSAGTLWLNLGDSYCSTDKWGGGVGGNTGKHTVAPDGSVPSWNVRQKREAIAGLKPKDLVGIPWMVAFALRADGWYLRSDIIWSKPNPMPESVTDRPTKAHEYLFLMSKSARYHYDADAIRTEPTSETRKMPDGWDTGAGGHGTIHRLGRERGRKTDKQRGHGRRHDGFNDRWDAMEKSEQQSQGANARTVWTIAPAPYPEAHFATFPEELPRRAILAGCAAGGTVLDPFAGSGTTLAVARDLGRKSIGIELNPKYVALIEKRCAQLALEAV